MIIEGDVSVKASLLGQKREVRIVYLDASRHDKDAWFIEKKCKEFNVVLERTSRDYIESLATGHTHGGVIAEVGQRKYDSLSCIWKAENPFVVLLEGVEDPYNLGYIMRTLYSAGCTALLLRNRNWDKNESTILKSSAGAFDYLPTILSDNLEEDILACKSHGLHVYAAMRRDAKTYFEGNYTKPVLLMIGGEMRGLSSKVLSKADENIYIPYANDFRNALNAAGAAAVLGFEVMRQRRGD
jgi:23S rRNA (guanosine2251-2'-O)-methyltransferase